MQECVAGHVLCCACLVDLPDVLLAVDPGSLDALALLGSRDKLFSGTLAPFSDFSGLWLHLLVPSSPSPQTHATPLT